MPTRLTTTGSLTLAAVLAQPLAASQVTGDFNGDGFADLAIGVPRERVSRSHDGAVHVIYGSATGLHASAARPDQLWHEGNPPGLGDEVREDDDFGAALAAGDFNNDGFDDLAIGVPGNKVHTHERAGAVHVLLGSAAGLIHTGAQFWHQDRPGVRNEVNTNDEFGSSLCAGDFDGDGFDDLAIGVPREDTGAPDPEFIFAADAGAVAVLFGSAAGLTADGDLLLNQSEGGIPDAPGALDRFGDVLSAGDFNGDGFDDLVIGVPDENLDGEDQAGIVHVLYGSANGPVTVGSQLWSQQVDGLDADTEGFDHFGRALATGDFNSDGFDDLAIGVPDEDTDGVVNAGLVHVLYGRSTGLKAGGSQTWEQNIADVLDGREPGDMFGAALIAGDFDGDGFGDLAIGVPSEGIGARDRCGAINLLYGSAAKLSAARGQFWHQGVAGVLNAPHFDDRFGSSLAAGDFDNDGRADLAIGVPREDVSGQSDAGAIQAMYGSAAGVRAARDQLWHQDVADVAENANDNERMGE